MLSRLVAAWRRRVSRLERECAKLDRAEEQALAEEGFADDRTGQAKVLELFGTVDFDPGYDFKEQRRMTRRPASDDDDRAT